MALNRDAAFRLKVNVDGANQISAFSRSLRRSLRLGSLSRSNVIDELGEVVVPVEH